MNKKVSKEENVIAQQAAVPMTAMTEGSVTGHILRFALPMLLGYLFPAPAGVILPPTVLIFICTP